jgi:hypothetical protein
MVSRRTAATTSVLAWFRVTAAPRVRAVSSLASDPLVTIGRAPRRAATWSAAIPTPPPTPQMSTVSPARSAARPASIRQAVSVASEKAAAWARTSARAPVPGDGGT